MTATQEEKNNVLIRNCHLTFASLTKQCSRAEAPPSLLAELALFIEDCELYLLPGYQMRADQRDDLKKLREVAIKEFQQLQQRHPEYTGASEHERIQELLHELKRLKNLELQATSFSERQRLVEDIDLRCFEYQRDLRKVVHAYGPELQTFLDAIEQIKTVRESLLNVDRPYFLDIKQQCKHGKMSIDELREHYLTYVEADGRDSLARIGSADYFLTHLIGVFHTPEHQEAFSDDMRHYYPTPASIFTHLLSNKLSPTDQDVIYDFGSGLGRLPLLTRLLTPALAVGIEYEPRYHQVAETLIDDLNLDNVRLVCGDAQEVDISDGTIFYFYEPFRGPLLQRVVEKIFQVAEQRSVTVVSYGKTQCTQYLREQDFLRLACSDHDLFILKTE